MTPLAVGDRVAVYIGGISGLAPYRIKGVVSSLVVDKIYGDSIAVKVDDSEPMYVHPKQCRRLEKATQGEYRAGYTLNTRFTSKWTEAEFILNNQIERKMVFVNFREDDYGTSRQLVSRAERDEDALFQVHCNPAFVKALCESWLEKKNEKTKIEIASMRDTVRNKLLADERDTLRAQVEQMRAALRDITEMAARYVSGTEGHYYEITEARKVLREIDEAMK